MPVSVAIYLIDVITELKSQESPLINVLIADDHHLVRSSIALLLENERDIHIVGEANDGETAVSQSRVVANRNLTWGGGSSRVFSSALKLLVDNMCTSSIRYTL